MFDAQCIFITVIVLLWQISGSLAVASVAHIVLGATGMVGLLMRYVGPLTVTPTVGMIGIGLFEAININCRHQWGITFG